MVFSHGWNNLLLSVSDNPIIIMSVIIVVCKVYFLFLRNQVNSIFDPFFMSVFSSAMATSLCIYMYMYGLFYEDSMFFSFIATEIAYLLGLKLFWNKHRKPNLNIYFINSVLMENILYYIYGSIFMLIQIVAISQVGLPIFSGESRLQFYDGGTGIFKVINSSIILPLIILIMKKKFSKNIDIFGKIFTLCVCFFIFIFLAGSGSKGSFLIIVYCLFFYKNFIDIEDYNSRKIVNKFLRFFAIFAVVMVFIVMAIEFSTTSLEALFYSFVMRLLAYGDIFAYYYSNTFVNLLILENNILYAIFGPCFALMRIINYSDLFPTIGLQIWQFVNSSMEIRGPNPRHNVFGVLYLGVIGGVFYSFFLGAIVNCVRSIWYNMKSKNLFVYIILSGLYFNLVNIASDISIRIVNVYTFILFNGFVFVISYIIYRMLRK